jgi:hypothetical protein
MTFTLPTASVEGKVRHVSAALFSNRVQDPVRSGPVQRRTGGGLASTPVQVTESVPGLLKMAT